MTANNYGRLVSPSSDSGRPIYNWHSFRHSFSKGFVKNLISEFGLPKKSWVLDPFCGGGTTLLACREFGINSMGFDILPFSVFLSKVKTRQYDPALLRKYLNRFEETGRSTGSCLFVSDIEIMRKAFRTDVLSELVQLKQDIARIRNVEIREFFMLGLLSILEGVSNTAKSGGFLRFVTRRVLTKQVRRRYFSRIDTMIRDVEQSGGTFKDSQVRTVARLADSRNLPTQRKFDAIITSPPYPNRHDYTRIYGLELILGFIKDNKELKNIRYNTIRSHVEAKKQFEPDGYSRPPNLVKLISRLKKATLNNTSVPGMIEGYFEDLYLSLRQMRKCLKRDGKIGLVVSNVRYAGVSIPVDKILAEVGEQSGLMTSTIFTARHRGNSSQQMKRFNRTPSRESVIIWTNP